MSLAVSPYETLAIREASVARRSSSNANALKALEGEARVNDTWRAWQGGVGWDGVAPCDMGWDGVAPYGMECDLIMRPSVRPGSEGWVCWA